MEQLIVYASKEQQDRHKDKDFIVTKKNVEEDKSYGAFFSP